MRLIAQRERRLQFPSYPKRRRTGVPRLGEPAGEGTRDDRSRAARLGDSFPWSGGRRVFHFAGGNPPLRCEGIIELITPMVAKMEMLALISLIFEEKIKCLLRTGND
uniref:Uncharacterized protein n=1 Tax=Oryza glumipatula TaxID=40148 RepID=A0A0E0A5D2_9ORYZ